MIGPEGAAQVVADLLEDHLAGTIDRLVTRLDALEGATRLERSYYSPQRIEPRQLPDLPVDDWPAFLVVARRLAGFRPVDVSAAAASASATVYAAAYELRVFTYARGTDALAVDLIRKRLTLAVREALLEHLAFSGAFGGETVRGSIDPLTLREEYSDLGEDDEAGPIAASQTDLVATLEEVTPHATPSPLASAAGVTVGAIPHPALD